jgi:O-antigen/teichoic acid export membrane protein
MDARRLLRNIGSQWVAHALTAVVGFVMPPFLLDRLGRDAYGVHNLIGDLGGYSALLYFGLGAAVLRYVAEHHAREEIQGLNETVSTIFAVYLRLGVFCLAVSCLLAVPLPLLFEVPSELAYEARARLVLTGVSILVEFVGSIYGGVLMGLERFDVLNGIKLVLLLGRTLATIVVVLRWPSVLAVGVVTLATAVAEQVFCFVYAHRVLPGLRVSLALNRPERLPTLVKFSAQSFLFTMSDRIINYTGNIVIAQARGAGATGPYAFALRLVDFAREALDRATHVLMPGFAAAAARGEAHVVRGVWRTGSKALLTLALPVALVQTLWGRHVLSLWLSKNSNTHEAARVVAEAYPCMVWLALAFVMQMAGRGLARPLFEGLGELRVPARIASMEAIANLALSLVFVRIWGIQGVALAVFLPAAITGLFVMPWFVCKRLGISFARHALDTYGRTLLPAFPAYGVLRLAERTGWHTRIASLAAACLLVLLVYLAFAWVVTFEGHERESLRARFRR